MDERVWVHQIGLVSHILGTPELMLICIIFKMHHQKKYKEAVFLVYISRRMP